jgi:hypothetical protein
MDMRLACACVQHSDDAKSGCAGTSDKRWRLKRHWKRSNEEKMLHAKSDRTSPRHQNSYRILRHQLMKQAGSDDTHT